MNVADDSLTRAQGLNVDIRHSLLRDGLYYVSTSYALLAIKAANPGREIAEHYKIPSSVRRILVNENPRRYFYCLADCLALQIRAKHFSHTEDTKASMRGPRGPRKSTKT